MNLSKRAGIFEPPPTMVKDIYQWALRVYAQMVWHHLKNKNAAQQVVHNKEYAKKLLVNYLVKLDLAFQTLDSSGGKPRLKIITYEWNGLTLKPKTDFVYSRSYGMSFRGSDWSQDAKEVKNTVRKVLQDNLIYIDDKTPIKKDFNDYRALRKIIQTNAGNIELDASRAVNEFSYDIKDWKYADEEVKISHEFWSQFSNVVQVVIEENSKKLKQYLGLWRDKAEVVEIILPQSVKDITSAKVYFDTLTIIKDSIRHELQHVGQSMLMQYKRLPFEPGKPSEKYQDPSYDYKGEFVPNSPLEGHGYKGEPQQHSLRQIEFYPRLRDDIDAFMRQYEKSSLNDRKKAFFVWIAQDDSQGSFLRSILFTRLKENHPKKYQKAIKEFYKQVRPILQEEKDEDI